MPPLTSELASHLADSYPHNHDWRIAKGSPRPSWQLRKRAWRLRRLYPQPSKVRSFVDLSSCKGYFVIDAIRRFSLDRALGIDVHDLDLAASQAAAAELNQPLAQYRHRFVHELAAEAPEPFDLALLINTYQYLFFGSRREPHAYRDHDAIFAHLADLVAPGGTLIFSNRVELERCPGHVRELAQECGLGYKYTHSEIHAAASKHFTVEERGKLGRIPLWRLLRK